MLGLRRFFFDSGAFSSACSVLIGTAMKTDIRAIVATDAQTEHAELSVARKEAAAVGWMGFRRVIMVATDLRAVMGWIELTLPLQFGFCV